MVVDMAELCLGTAADRSASHADSVSSLNRDVAHWEAAQLFGSSNVGLNEGLQI